MNPSFRHFRGPRPMVSTNAGMNTPDRGASGVGVVNPRSPLVARGKYDPGNYRDDRGESEGLGLGVVGIKPSFTAGTVFSYPPQGAVARVRNLTKKQKVIQKARNSLSVSQTRGMVQNIGGPKVGLVGRFPVAMRSMSSRSDRGSAGEGLDVDSDNMPPLVRRINSASLTVKTMSKPISLVKRIQNDVAESAFQEIQEQMSIPLEKRTEALGEMDTVSKQNPISKKPKTNNNKKKSSKKEKEAEPKYSKETLEKQRMLAVARVVSKKRSEVERQRSEEEARKSTKFDNVDLERMRLMAAQRATEAQKEAKQRNEKEANRKKSERENRAMERRKEEEAKTRRRAEIYAINNVMRDAFEEQFREFAATQLANGEGHSVVLDELGLDDARGGTVGGGQDFTGIGAV
ncbi:hypothetical protein TrLO_g1453 [Triparma laevis f. longispina]|uniref:Uncharacterized protein n=1 Tax=Triparma laevis f. longispina TaxID=1714387 RepID=A0A9W7AVS2_9STRA|nr:hypothetical protein TrLO_g1453 [Triparma laevis f. longispina]